MHRIVFVITGLNHGGAETALYRLLKAINRNKFKIKIISLTGGGAFANKISSLGIEVVTLNFRKKKTIPLMLASYARLIREFKPDIVQGWMYHANILAIAAKCLKPSCKVLFNIRNGLDDIKSEKTNTLFAIRTNAFLSYLTSGVINNSKRSISQHTDNGFSAKKNIHIPNGFNTNKFCPNETVYYSFREQQGWSNDTKIIGNIARFHPVKDHITLLKAYKNVLSTYTGKVKLVLVGKNIDSNNEIITSFLRENDIINDCLLLGEKNANEIMPVFDLFVLSSLSEGFPNVLGEAISCGVPCISTDVGDSKEVISGYGDTVSVGDEHQLAQACLRVISQGNSKKTEMHNYIKNKYGLTSVVKQYENLYLSLIH